MPAPPFSLDSTVIATPRHVACDLSSEAVILNLENGVYYGLNEVGTRIWSLLAEPCSVGSICNAILAEFEIDEATCRSDVLSLLKDLSDQGLIRIEPE